MKLPKVVDDNLVLIIAMGICAALLIGISSVQKPCCNEETKKVNSK